jgi:hypothetical protein
MFGRPVSAKPRLNMGQQSQSQSQSEYSNRHNEDQPDRLVVDTHRQQHVHAKQSENTQRPSYSEAKQFDGNHKNANIYEAGHVRREDAGRADQRRRPDSAGPNLYPDKEQTYPGKEQRYPGKEQTYPGKEHTYPSNGKNGAYNDMEKTRKCAPADESNKNASSGARGVDASEWTTEQVCAWLDSVGFGDSSAIYKEVSMCRYPHVCVYTYTFMYTYTKVWCLYSVG